MKDAWLDLTRQDLIKLRKTMTGLQIAEKYGVHHNAVYYRMRMFGLTKPRASREFNPPKEELAALYRDKSMADVAKHYGVGETIVFSRLRDYRIPLISKSERMTGKPKSLAHRLAMSKSALLSGVRAGPRNGNWKGGKSGANKAARSKAAYHEWKAAVLERAKWKCSRCKSEHGSLCKHCGHRVLLHAHHIKPFDTHPERRYDTKNGVALCQRCHMTEHHIEIG